jgi:release factor glutamine methyltransferase
MRELIKRVTDDFNITRDEAELIVATLLERPRFEMYMNNTLDDQTATMLSIKLKQLKKGIPLEYITKRVQFRDYLLSVYPGVFIPRVETEYLIECIEHAVPAPPKTILEIGVGCGAISIALAQLYPQAHIVATDISPRALRCAQDNIDQLGLQKRITLIRNSLYDGISSTFDLIVSNPPYVALSRLQSLPKSVRDFEPLVALNGGKNGITIIYKLIHQGIDYLASQGMMALEIDENQVALLTQLLRTTSVHSFSFQQDLYGRYRYLFIGTFNNEKSKNSY